MLLGAILGLKVADILLLVVGPLIVVRLSPHVPYLHISFDICRIQKRSQKTVRIEVLHIMIDTDASLIPFSFSLAFLIFELKGPIIVERKHLPQKEQNIGKVDNSNLD